VSVLSVTAAAYAKNIHAKSATAQEKFEMTSLKEFVTTILGDSLSGQEDKQIKHYIDTLEVHMQKVLDKYPTADELWDEVVNYLRGKTK
jgi:hypothetical protein